MSKESYPTGVENHGKSLRIWFIFKGKRVRENLGVPDTLKTERWQVIYERRFVSPYVWETLIMHRSSPTHLT